MKLTELVFFEDVPDIQAGEGEPVATCWEILRQADEARTKNIARGVQRCEFLGEVFVVLSTSGSTGRFVVHGLLCFRAELPCVLLGCCVYSLPCRARGGAQSARSG